MKRKKQNPVKGSVFLHSIIKQKIIKKINEKIDN